MKNKIYTIIMALLVCVGATAYAEVANTRKTSPPINTSSKQNIEDLKNEASTTRSEIKNQLEQERTRIDEQRKEMVRKVFGNQLKKVGIRLEATIVRIEGLMARVNSRIEKIKNAGGKTETAEKYVAEAKTHLAEARAELAKMKVAGDTALTNVSSTTPPVKDLMNIKASSKTIEKHLQEAHKALEKAVGSLKGVSSTVPTATSTKTTN